MNVRQARIAGIPLATDLAPLVEIAPQLVLVLGSVKPLTAPGLLEILEEVFPQAGLAGCTTAGEIGTGAVTDSEIVITALHFQPVEVAACGDGSGGHGGFPGGRPAPGPGAGRAGAGPRARAGPGRADQWQRPH
ncbi:FIST N-terminal domain-containing protein [Candidatus Skiveiella danica]|uniref:FIST N-terminal domain-containing protein n=1 Tax=Candidatus Skiveiella danica TaxID=3386177 RepID=UPI0039B95FD9